MKNLQYSQFKILLSLALFFLSVGSLANAKYTKNETYYIEEICKAAEHYIEASEKGWVTEKSRSRWKINSFTANLKKTQPDFEAIDYSYKRKSLAEWLKEYEELTEEQRTVYYEERQNSPTPVQTSTKSEQTSSVVSTQKNLLHLYPNESSMNHRYARSHLDKIGRLASKGIGILENPQYTDSEKRELTRIYENNIIDVPTYFSNAGANPLDYLEVSARENIDQFISSYQEYIASFDDIFRRKEIEEAFLPYFELLQETTLLLKNEPLEQDINSNLNRNLRVISSRLDFLKQQYGDIASYFNEEQLQITQSFQNEYEARITRIEEYHKKLEEEERKRRAAELAEKDRLARVERERIAEERKLELEKRTKTLIHKDDPSKQFSYIILKDADAGVAGRDRRSIHMITSAETKADRTYVMRETAKEAFLEYKVDVVWVKLEVMPETMGSGLLYGNLTYCPDRKGNSGSDNVPVWQIAVTDRVLSEQELEISRLWEIHRERFIHPTERYVVEEQLKAFIAEEMGIPVSEVRLPYIVLDK